MKLLSGVLISEVENEYVAVTLGEAGKKFNGMIRMNGTAAFLLKKLQNEISEEGLVAALLAEYDVSEEDAKANVASVLQKLRQAGLIEE